MSEERIEKLLDRYADQLSPEELAAAIPAELRHRLREIAIREGSRKGRIMRFWPYWAGVAALAACVVFTTLPREDELSIESMTISPMTVRGGESLVDVSLSLNRTGYTRVVVIDDRHEPWIMPFDSGGKIFVLRLDQAASLTVDARPNPRHPDALAIFIMLVVTPDEHPTAEQLLHSIPDPIVPSGAADTEFHRAMNQLCGKLKAEFKCAVRFTPVPSR